MKFTIVGIALFLIATIGISCANNDETGKEPPANDGTQDETSQINDEENPDFVLWKLSLSVARNLNDHEERAITLEIIAENLATSARFDKAVDVALEIESDFLQSRVLAGISNSMLIPFETDNVNETLELALEVCNRMDESLDKSSVLSRIASSFKAAGNQEMADEIFAQSKAIMDNIRKDFSFTDLGDNSMFDILHQIDINTADAVSFADNLEFEKALNDVKNLKDAASGASALSYIALCLDYTEFEITDKMHQTMDVISRKWVDQKISG